MNQNYKVQTNYFIKNVHTNKKCCLFVTLYHFYYNKSIELLRKTSLSWSNLLCRLYDNEIIKHFFLFLSSFIDSCLYRCVYFRKMGQTGHSEASQVNAPQNRGSLNHKLKRKGSGR